MTAEDLKQQKAKNLRYKKPLMRDMSLDAIRSAIWEMQDVVGDVQWFVQDETRLPDHWGIHVGEPGFPPPPPARSAL